MGTITDKLNKLNETKQNIKSAIVSNGVAIADDVPFSEYGDKIKQISASKTYLLKVSLHLGYGAVINGTSYEDGDYEFEVKAGDIVVYTLSSETLSIQIKINDNYYKMPIGDSLNFPPYNPLTILKSK